MALEIEPSSPAQNSLWPLALLGILVSYLAILRQQKKGTSKAIHPQQTASNKSTNMGVLVVPNVPPTPTQCSYADRCKDHTPKWKKATEVILAVSTTGLLLINIFLWLITRDSLKLTRLTAEATYAGVIVPDIAIAADQVSVIFANKGKGVARNVCAEFDVVRETIPQEISIEEIRNNTVCDSTLQVGEGPSHYIYLPNLTKSDWDALLDTKQAVKAFGHFRYYNGFEEITGQPFCLIITGQPGHITGRTRCSGLRAFLDSLLTPEERWEKQAHP